MRLNRPIQAIIIGSAGLALLVILIMFTIHLATDVVFSLLMYILFPLITGVAGFTIFGIIFQKFLNERIKVIYRVISRKKFEDEDYEMSITDDVFNTLEEDTKLIRSKNLKNRQHFEENSSEIWHMN